MPTGIYKRKLKPIKIGQKFGKLTIIKEVEPYIMFNGYKRRRVLCKNNNNGAKIIILCNNLYRKLSLGKNCNHKMAGTKFYKTWISINQRCSNKKQNSYKYYGGRNIRCEWSNFIEFKRDMYESYLEHLKKFGKINTTIDRIDNNGNYYKENCHWATYKEQGNNKRNNYSITYQNKTQTIKQWADELNINYGTLYTRMSIYNWSIKKSLTIKLCN